MRFCVEVNNYQPTICEALKKLNVREDIKGVPITTGCGKNFESEHLIASVLLYSEETNKYLANRHLIVR